MCIIPGIHRLKKVPEFQPVRCSLSWTRISSSHQRRHVYVKVIKVKVRPLFAPEHSAQKSKAAATIPMPGYIYPSTRQAWVTGVVLKTRTEGEEIASVNRVLITN